MDYGLLGTTSVSGADGPISLTRAQSRTLLVLLLLSPGQVVAMHTIIDALWPEDGPEPPKNADNAVHQVVKNIRKVLGDPALVERIPPGYLIRADPAEVDACRFRDAVVRARAEKDVQRRVALLRNALALWRGAPLNDVPTSALDVERRRLTDLRVEALDLCAAAELELGHHKEVIAELRSWVAEHPVSERLHHHLLVATFRCDGQGEALRAYDSCRRQLVEAAGADPGADLRELHTKILRDDPGLLEAGTATFPSRREQLPFAPRVFTGRTAELRTLSAVSGSEGGLWVITGPGGIGKTTLVIHWAHENRHRFPDGNIFVDLQGHTPGGSPLPTGAALRGFLDAMGVDPRGIPPQHHAQVALWRSLSYGKRMLVVLDNAANAEQITDLLPASGTCTVLITSRDQLTPLIASLGADHLRIGVLDNRDALAVLSARSGKARLAADPAAVRDLLDLCAGLPLALSVVAGRLQTDTTTPLAELVADLREELLTDAATDGGRVSVPSVLSWSYNSLDEWQARAFCLLGIAPGPDVSLAAAASLLALPTGQTRQLLRRLAEQSLLERTPSGRFRMHDLVRAHAAGRAERDLPEDERGPALRRAIGYYLYSAFAADRLLHPPRTPIPLSPPPAGCVSVELPDRAAAVAWFDVEHRCLLAAQRTAADIAWYEAGWQLAWAAHTFHHRRGHRRDHIVSWRIGKDCAEAEDAAVRGLVFRLYGGACARAGELDDAQRSFRVALALAERADDVFGQAHTHQFLGWYWLYHGDAPLALTHATTSLTLFESLDDPPNLADVLNLLGLCAVSNGDLPGGLDRCTAALVRAKRGADRDGEAAALDSLGSIAAKRGDHLRAVEHYQRAAILLAELGNTYALADTLERLGDAHLGCDRDPRVAWNRAMNLFREQLRDDDADRVQGKLTAGQYSGRSS